MWWKNKKLNSLKKLSERRLEQLRNLTEIVHSNMRRLKTAEDKNRFYDKNTVKITEILEKQQDLIEDLQKDIIELKTKMGTFLN